MRARARASSSPSVRSRDGRAARVFPSLPPSVIVPPLGPRSLLTAVPPAPAAAAEKPKLPADFEAKAWDALSGAIDAIHAKARPRSIITHIYTGPHTTAFAS